MKFKKILLLVKHDFSVSDIAFKQALLIAEHNQAQLDMLYVVPDLSKLHNGESIEKIKEFTSAAVAAAKLTIQTQLVSLNANHQHSVLIRTGKQYLSAIQTVLAENYDLLVKETENPSWLESIFGSEDLNLLRKCPIPLWLVHAGNAYPCKNIVAAVDVSSNQIEKRLNTKIAYQAASVAYQCKANAYLLSAYEAPSPGYSDLWAKNVTKPEKDFLKEEEHRRTAVLGDLEREIKEGITEPNAKPLALSSHVVKGRPENVIPKFSKSVNADLVVLGTIGRSGFAGVLIGNTAEGVLPQLRCSVLALKPEDFVSPVL